VRKCLQFLRSCKCLCFFNDGVVTALFKFDGKLFVATADDASVDQYVNVVGLDVVQQPLVVGNDDGGEVGTAHRVDAVGNDFQGVDV